MLAGNKNPSTTGGPIIQISSNKQQESPDDESISPSFRSPQRKLTRTNTITKNQRRQSGMKSPGMCFSFSQVIKELKPTVNLKNINLDQLSQDQILEIVQIILQKSPETRSLIEIKTLYKATENVEFFKKYDNETHEQICKFLTLIEMTKNSTLFEIGIFEFVRSLFLGSIGTKFYIILKGSIGIWVNIPKNIVDEKKNEIKTEFILTEVKTLFSGSSFGELALMEQKPRAATIICKEDCCFGVLDKAPFDRILKKKEQKILYENIDFLAGQKIFLGWSYHAVKKLFYQGEIIKFKRNEFLFEEGDESKGLYIIKSGEIKVFKKVKLRKNYKGEKGVDDISMQQFNIKDNISFIKKFEIEICSLGMIIGEEEMINGHLRKFSAQCFSTTADVFFLNKKEVQRRILTDEGSLNYIKTMIERREKWILNRENFFIKTEKEYILPKFKENNEKSPIEQRFLEKMKSISNESNINQSKEKKKNSLRLFLEKQNTVIHNKTLSSVKDKKTVKFILDNTCIKNDKNDSFEMISTNKLKLHEKFLIMKKKFKFENDTFLTKNKEFLNKLMHQYENNNQIRKKLKYIKKNHSVKSKSIENNLLEEKQNRMNENKTILHIKNFNEISLSKNVNLNSQSNNNHKKFALTCLEKLNQYTNFNLINKNFHKIENNKRREKINLSENNFDIMGNFLFNKIN